MLKFVGDLSLEDAALLERYASRARRVLEFGVGGSTQILSQAVSPDATLVSIDTDPAWIEVTRQRLRHIGVDNRCRFLPYEGWLDATKAISPSFDLIFDDGVDEHRRSFALTSWELLEPGGFMLFHDTRRFGDFVNVAWLAQTYFEEVAEARFNERVGGNASNISVVLKKEREPYVDWRFAEGKPMWQYGGLEEIPEDFWATKR